METKQRHGCLIAWLVLMMIGNSITAGFYFFASDMVVKKFPNGISQTTVIILGALAALNLVFAINLWQWKRWAFWGFAITSLVAFAINLSLDMGIMSSILGLSGIAFLYGVLQIKSKTIPAGWDNLE